jgi:5-methylcytosine-specific restriction protein A
MPTAPPRYCSTPGCPQKQPCSVHVRVQGRYGWRNDTHRIRGRRLQRLRSDLLSDEPFCRACHVRLATIRDHVVPLAEGGTDDPSNIQPLCPSCSDEKTQRESRRGRGMR